MPEELENESEAINAIYGDGTLKSIEMDGVLVLSIPQREAALRIAFPAGYPELIPQILGIEETGVHARKGYGTFVLGVAREVLQSIFNPGSVCLFDLLEELHVALPTESDNEVVAQLNDQGKASAPASDVRAEVPHIVDKEPQWAVSQTVTVKKSTFIARACIVTSPAEARMCLAHLLENDKRASKATHNITAYRIRSPPCPGSLSEIKYEDCDDDGETAAGGRLLHLLQLMNVWGVLVVVSRWYGGVKLGPDRFNIINNIARQAIVEGGSTKSKTMQN